MENQPSIVPESTKEGFISAQINDKIMPLERGKLYTDPLIDFLSSKGYGGVPGEGTMQGKSGELSFCNLDIELSVDDPDKKAVKEIIQKLEDLGAPKGSKIIIEKTGEQIPFGKLEGLGLYLDGVNLPKNVYAECDSNFVLSEIKRLTGYKGDIDRYWQGNTETAFYLYGESFEKMRSSILEFVNTYPLCKGARVVQIA